MPLRSLLFASNKLSPSLRRLSVLTRHNQSQYPRIHTALRNPNALVSSIRCASTDTSKMSDEASKAMSAAPEEVTIFDSIVAGKIPANVIYEDDLCMAFMDVAPVAEFHALLIPKKRGRLSQLSKAEEDDKALLGHLMYSAKVVAEKMGLSEGGYRLVINDGKNGLQSVYHLHIHIIGGETLAWPPGVNPK